jgi:ribA/ribD-fused uncharacterized protein
MAVISFTNVNLPYGWLGNMAAFPINYQNERWRTSEALFQAMRFEDEEIRQIIQAQRSPIGAKKKAKRLDIRHLMIVAPCSQQDVENMRICLDLKFSQHPEIRKQLIRTGNDTLVEDVSKRPNARSLFWGMEYINDQWVGTNTLGLLLMELREKLQNEL